MISWSKNQLQRKVLLPLGKPAEFGHEHMARWATSGNSLRTGDAKRITCVDHPKQHSGLEWLG